MIPSSPKRQHPLIFGVINLTPNSFSDGGLYLNREKLQQTLREWSSCDDLVPDIGAESTAPMNQKISFEEEMARLDKIFSVHQDDLKKFSSLSFDTYKTSTFLSILDRLNSLGYRGKIYWNDVSGSYDQDVERLLSQNSQLTWILCHTLVTERALSSDHKKFSDQLSPDTVIKKMQQWFLARLELIPKNLYQQLMLDPCFGFSKDIATNIALSESVDQLIEGVGGELPWLLGISKKSFLQAQLKERALLPEMPNYQMELEMLHSAYLKRWGKLPYSHRLSFRVHQPQLVRDALFA